MKLRVLLGTVIFVPSFVVLVWCAVTYAQACSRAPRMDAAKGQVISFSCRKLHNRVYVTELEYKLMANWLFLSLMGVFLGGAIAKDR